MALPYRIESHSDTYFVGKDGRPTGHLVNAVIVPDSVLHAYPYAHDFRSHCCVDVRVTEGNDSVRSLRVHEGSNLISFLVDLQPPAEADEKRLIGFEVNLDYHTLPPPELRRSTGEGDRPEIESWEMAVCFSRELLPAAVNWAEWDVLGSGGAIVDGTVEPLELIPLDEEDPESPYFVARVQRTNMPNDRVCGITWKW